MKWIQTGYGTGVTGQAPKAFGCRLPFDLLVPRRFKAMIPPQVILGRIAARCLGWIIALMCCCCLHGEPVYPLKVSTNGRYLVDQNNVPFLLQADTPQKMVRNCNSNDLAFYIQNRATNGFNALQSMFAFDHWDNYGATESAFNSTLSGGYPDFTSAPNTNFWNYVAWITDIAASNGICMFWCPTETGTQLPAFRANGTNACFQYGQFIGTFFKDKPNIVWMHGNDHQTWTNAADDALILAVAEGIRSVDPNHLQTVILNFLVSMSTDDERWWPYLDLNCNYDYSPQYANTARAYALTNLPVFLGEGHYAYESTGGPWQEPTTDLMLRHQFYWTMLSGGCGQVFGTYYSWSFDVGWQNYLNIPAVTQCQHALSLFTNRAWYNLVPDANHTLLVAGYGQWDTNTLISQNTHATAASAPDGTLAMIYMPNNANRTLTVNLSAFTNQVKAQWFDPVSGGLSMAAGSPFTNAGLQNFSVNSNNAGGDQDWVLVLEAEADPSGHLRVNFIEPAGGATVSNLVQIAAEVTGNEAPFEVRFEINGLNHGDPLTTHPFHALWNTVEHPNGLHQIDAIATDSLGRVATNAVVVQVQNVLSPVPADTLVAAYGFDEGQGSATADSSGHGNTGMIQGAAWTNAGLIGRALTFKGDGWVTVNNSSSLSPTNGLTLCAWVNPATTASWSTVLMKEGAEDLAYALYAAGFHGEAPTAIIKVPAPCVLGGQGTPIPSGVWTHLAATHDRSVFNLYVNGSLVASKAASGSVIPSDGPLRIGGNSLWGEYFAGRIDELRIYERALSPSEIVADMGTPTSLLPQVTLVPAQQSTQQIITNGFHFSIKSKLPVTGTIEWSSNLDAWQLLTPFVYSNSPVDVIDLESRSNSQRYYRAVTQP